MMKLCLLAMRTEAGFSLIRRVCNCLWILAIFFFFSVGAVVISHEETEAKQSSLCPWYDSLDPAVKRVQTQITFLDVELTSYYESS